MSKTQSSPQWKSISVNEQLASEGLVGVEECSEYEIISAKIPQVIKRQSDKSAHTTEPKKKRSRSSKSHPVSLEPSKCGSSLATNVQVPQISSIWSNYGIPLPVVKALTMHGFEKPTQIQDLVLPSAISGQNIVGVAETGSGKTLAFGLPILTGILTRQLKEGASGNQTLYALVLTPTRELAVQVKDHLMAAAKFTDIKVVVLVGGMAAVKQERLLKKNPEIIVATPGRLWELIQNGNDYLSQIGSIKYLVIDETDRMLEKGHFEEMHQLLERLNFDQASSAERQNFIFSATLSLVHDLPKYLANKSNVKKMTPQQKLQQIIKQLGIDNPKIVDITLKNIMPEGLTESKISCSFEEKDFYLYYFLQKHQGRTIVFCNSVGCVKRLANLLGILQCRALALHSSMQQKHRLKSLERFRDEENLVLVATDVAARGLDIPKVENVLHYQIPRTNESYVHRSGRTARASNRGLTLLLIEPSEIPSYIKLCKNLNKSEDLPAFPIQDDYFNAIKKRVNLARKIDKLEIEVKKNNSEEGWLQNAAREMDIIVDFPRRHDEDSDDARIKKKTSIAQRKELSFLLTKPIFPKEIWGKYPLHPNSNVDKEQATVEVIETVGKKKKTRFSLFKAHKK